MGLKDDAVCCCPWQMRRRKSGAGIDAHYDHAGILLIRDAKDRTRRQTAFDDRVCLQFGRNKPPELFPFLEEIVVIERGGAVLPGRQI